MVNIKKLLASGLVIVLFLLYSGHQKNEEEAFVITPNNRQPSGSSLPSPSPLPTAGIPSAAPSKGIYKDGQYTGPATDAFYGQVQVRVSIKNGQLADVQFLQYPNDRSTSIEINSQAMPLLTQEAIQAQNGSVDIVSGATDTSQAFIESLSSALNQAKN